MAAIQGPKPEPKHRIESGPNPASTNDPVDGGNLGDGMDSASQIGKGLSHSVEATKPESSIRN